MLKNNKQLLIVLLFSLAASLFSSNNLNAQDTKKDSTDLFKLMDDNDKKAATQAVDYTTNTFKGTHVICGPSIETIGEGNLDFKISHRFAPLNGGIYTLFGLDGPATIRFGLDYGVTNRLMVGVGRSNLDKEYDGYVKYKILRQSTGKRNMPFTLTYQGGASVITDASTIKSYKITKEENKWVFAHALLLSRKFNDAFSFQIMPTLVHYNKVPNYATTTIDSSLNKNDFFSLGVGGRLGISKRVKITGEYYYQFDKLKGMQNSFSLGLDIETGGHVFQLHFTNSTGMTERTYITQTAGKWNTGDVRFGFTISRIFTLKKVASKIAW